MNNLLDFDFSHISHFHQIKTSNVADIIEEFCLNRYLGFQDTFFNRV